MEKKDLLFHFLLNQNAPIPAASCTFATDRWETHGNRLHGGEQMHTNNNQSVMLRKRALDEIKWLMYFRKENLSQLKVFI